MKLLNSKMMDQQNMLLSEKLNTVLQQLLDKVKYTNSYVCYSQTSLCNQAYIPLRPHASPSPSDVLFE